MTETVKNFATALRALSIDAIEKSKSGHPGLPLGMADVMSVLWINHLTFYPKDTTWLNRDRFILSAGHGSMLLYSTLHLFGLLSKDDLMSFRQLNSKTPGHPEYGHTPGVETTTGPLGQGIATAVGIALCERLTHAKTPKVDHYTYVLASDGDLMEGISHEALSLAGHLNLNKLIILWDNNSITIDGKVSLACSEDTLKRLEAYGFNVISINGHDYSQIDEALLTAKKSEKPTFIACETTIGYGAPTKAGTSGVHGSPLGENEAGLTKQALNWTHQPFEVPSSYFDIANQAISRSEKLYTQWMKAPYVLENGDATPALEALKNTWQAQKPKLATRQASEEVLKAITPHLPQLIGGSADLSPSNNTKTASQSVISKDNYAGSYIHYGIREHAMAAIMNGLALYGYVPYGGTFLVFSDYLKPSLRLSALMRKKVIYVLTHDSIGLGEDGPTHQPIEHLCSLRSIPGLQVLRPADALETLAAWQLALAYNGPTVLALSRQPLPPFERLSHGQTELDGGYIIYEDDHPTITLFASGSEVPVALKVAELLKDKRVRVVSILCLEKFMSSDLVKTGLLEDSTHKVAIEAAHPLSWHQVVGRTGQIFGLETFGASAPIDDLYTHFGLTPEKIAQEIIKWF